MVCYYRRFFRGMSFVMQQTIISFPNYWQYDRLYYYLCSTLVQLGVLAGRIAGQ